MSTTIVMPKMGMHMTEGTIVAWLKTDGEMVEKGELLLEVENDKVVNEVVAESAGTLTILVAEGEACPVGTPLARIAAQAEQPAAIVAPKPAVRSERNGRSAEHFKQRSIRSKGWTYETPPVVEGIRASPLARRVAQGMGIDLTLIQGSGPQGRILQHDVLAYQPQTAAARPPESAEPEADIWSLSVRQRHTAAKLVHSLQTTAQYTLTARLDVTELAKTRQILSRHWSEKITYTSLMVAAVAVALKQHPQLTAVWQEERALIPRQLDVGVAVATDQGLIVPVVRQADHLSVLEIQKQVNQLSERARQKQLKSEDLGGGCFTISNLGMYGIEWFTPILNPPESAILGVGQIEEVLVRYNSEIGDRKQLPLSLTVDHRLIDGAVGAAFLQTLRGVIETPLLIFVE